MRTNYKNTTYIVFLDLSWSEVNTYNDLHLLNSERVLRMNEKLRQSTLSAEFVAQRLTFAPYVHAHANVSSPAHSRPIKNDLEMIVSSIA